MIDKIQNSIPEAVDSMRDAQTGMAAPTPSVDLRLSACQPAPASESEPAGRNGQNLKPAIGAKHFQSLCQKPLCCRPCAAVIHWLAHRPPTGASMTAGRKRRYGGHQKRCCQPDQRRSETPARAAASMTYKGQQRRHGPARRERRSIGHA
jgi:hypothetical protein